MSELSLINDAMDFMNDDEEHLINYSSKLAVSNNWKPLQISFEDVDNYDFSKGFNEILSKPEQVHLYFDFDSISSEDDYDDVIDEKDSLDACITSPSTTMEIIEDPLLKENECMIESDSGIFDCSLGVELSELSRKLKLLSFDRVKR